jgi:hypothetical protein
VGEYLEVVDADPPSGCVYDPVDLNNPYLLAQDGLRPSEGNPQFHQQMVYAVAMRTIRNFEIALGRRALWAERVVPAGGKRLPTRAFVRRLRVYPHALREANAYYSPDKRALLFGYFPASTSPGGGQLVFTCLSHDVIAHECTHALLDGIHHYYQEQTNIDVPAFHEAFADIVAIFQHFTFPELLKFQLSQARGDLSHGELMANLATSSVRRSGSGARCAARSGHRPAGTPTPRRKSRTIAAASWLPRCSMRSLAIYQRRTQDLMRLASGGMA